jgi:FkbM family methyltransferase
MDLADQLHALYCEPSKHHAYQNVPDFVSDALGYRETIDDRWRGDHCRLNYLLSVMPVAQWQSLTDIGANTGFFTLSLAHRFPELQVTACEPDRTHAKFIRTIANTFGMRNVEVMPKGVTLRSLSGFQRKDAVLLLNNCTTSAMTSTPRCRARATRSTCTRASISVRWPRSARISSFRWDPIGVATRTTHWCRAMRMPTSCGTWPACCSTAAGGFNTWPIRRGWTAW